MEALTAAAVAALTVYDMTKALDKSIVIRHIRLEAKSGGKSGISSGNERRNFNIPKVQKRSLKWVHNFITPFRVQTDRS